MIAIISDIHANLEALEAVLREIRSERIGTIVCLGDIVGYNADPSACIGLLRDAGAVCIAGNHDRAVTGQITTEGFNPLAVRAVDWTRPRLTADEVEWLAALPLKATVQDRLIAVHGALHPDVGCELVRLDTDEKRQLSFEALAAHPSGVRLCAFGHTHRLGIYEMRDGAVTAHHHQGDKAMIREGSLYLVNPGTVGQPRTSDRRASYLVLDPDAGTISIRRIRYDASPALAKTRKAGLAPRLSRLPEPVRKPLRRIYRAIVG
jgi:predicted phosphodiesterase